MNVLLTAVTVYWLFIIAVAVLHTRQVLYFDHEAMWDYLSDPLLLLFLLISGLYFSTKVEVLFAALWAPTMVLYGTFLTLYLLDQWMH